MHRFTLCGLLALIAGGFSDARADPVLTTTPSGKAYLVDNSDVSNTIWTVVVDQSAASFNDNILVTITFDGVEEEYDAIFVETLPSSFGQTLVRLEINGAQDPLTGKFTLQRINTVKRTSGSGELWLQNLAANQVGDLDRDPMSLTYGERTGEIVANRITTIEANWSVVAEKIEATGSARNDASGPDINLIRTTNQFRPFYALDGAIVSDIITRGGNIGTIEAESFIGSVGDYLQVISTKTPNSSNYGNITEILAGSLGLVNIDTGGIAAGGGTIGLIRTSVGGWGYDIPSIVDLNSPRYCPIFGDPDNLCAYDPDDESRTQGGFLTAKELTTLELKGSLDSDLLMSDEQTGTWKIGDSLGPNALLTFKNFGIGGQIAINANGGEGEWLGVVRTANGNDLINGPFFVMDEEDHNLSLSMVGYGSAGLQGYRLWGASCDPAPGQNRFRGYIDPNSLEIDPPCIEDFDEIIVGFYGKITTAPDVDIADAIKLYRTNFFGVYVQVSGVEVTDLGNRKIGLKKSDNSIWDYGDYKVEIIANKLVVNSSDVLTGGAQLSIPSTVYYFSVVRGCAEFDLNRDGLLDADDLSAWFDEPVNLNNHPQIDGDDFLTLLRGVQEHGN